MSERARFRRMDQASAEDWSRIREGALAGQPRAAERILSMLRSLAEIEDGFLVNQLVHATQTATRAENAGADDELVLAALCHDIGKSISVFGHAEIAAAILEPYVSPDTTWVLRHHQVVQGRHYMAHFGGETDAWKALESDPRFETLWRFVEEWDQTSFDPDFPTRPLEHFEPLVRSWFAVPRAMRK